jgi:hypothetical protein
VLALIAFVISGLNPFGGAFVAIPIAIFQLGWAPWLAVALTIPLVYAQVVAVDLLWDRLLAWPAWLRFVEKRRSARLERILARRDAGVWLALLGPWIGCWLVIAAARFGGHRQSKVALPLLIGITYLGALTAAICVFAPDLLPKSSP